MNEYYGENDWRDYLAHHGILGMKWGKRNGPPYPLSASDHSASEKKAGWRKSLSERSDEKVKQRRAADAKRASKEYPESARIQRFKDDLARAKEASTDEEHDRLERIADTRNSLTYKTGLNGKYHWYELNNEKAHFVLDNNNDTAIEVVHKIEDNFSEIDKACRKAVSENVDYKISDKPSIDVFGAATPAWPPMFNYSAGRGTVTVLYDLDKKKAYYDGFND